MQSSGKIPVGNHNTVQHPDIGIPISLVLFAVFCVVWAAGALFYAVSAQLLNDNIVYQSTGRMIAQAVFGFIAPVFTANAILMNWRAGRWLIVATVVGGLLVIVFEMHYLTEAAISNSLWAFAVASCVGLYMWLFQSGRVSAYFRALTDADVAMPDPSQPAARLAASLDRLAPWVEWMGFALCAGAFAAALSMVA